MLAKQRRWSHVSLFGYFLSKTRNCWWCKLQTDKRFNRVGLGWVGLSFGIFGDCQMLNLCFGCWSAWNCYKLSTLFAGMESQIQKFEDSHHSNLSSCNFTILWTFRSLVSSTSIASDLKHVVVIQEFVVWQGCWTNPHYVRLFRPLWAGLESLPERYDTPHSHTPTILFAALYPDSKVMISWAMLDLCNFQFTWWICAFHSHFNTLRPT